MSEDEIMPTDPIESLEVEEPEESVEGYLDKAIQLATEEEMPAAELMGIFYYYSHGIAESYRQEVLAEQESASQFQSE